MSLHLAGRMEKVKASAIREILKLTQEPTIISFAGGLPAVETFPAQDLIEVSTRVLREHGTQALQYSPTEGYPPLRQLISERMNRRMGTHVRPEEILVTSGSQQGLDLSAKVLIDPGDVILCESPTYLGAIGAFKAYEPRFIEIETDDDGMVPADLEAKLSTVENVRFIYVIPDFQNPSGRTWSLERRKAVMELVRRFEIPVIEDCPYSEVRFEGEHLPPLKSMEGSDWVIYLGTFSKVFCPGMRMAWLAASQPVLGKIILTKQGTDLHTQTLGQMQLADYLEHFDLDANINKTIKLYRERRDAMLAKMEEFFPSSVKWTHPEGGMFLWVTLPEGINASELLDSCLKEKVAFVPGAPFFPNGGHENTMRMNYSASNPEKIAIGVERMARVIREAIKTSGGAAS